MKELNYNTSILVVAIHARNDANNFKLLYPKIKEETKYTLCLNGDKTSQTFTLVFYAAKELPLPILISFFLISFNTKS